MKKVKIYLVGDENANKTNQWLIMTNDLAKAAEFAEGLPVSQIKTILVGESKYDSK